MARLATERRLQDAEQRLVHLEKGIEDHGKVDKAIKEDKKNEMIGDVKAIRSKLHHIATGVACTDVLNFCLHLFFTTVIHMCIM